MEAVAVAGVGQANIGLQGSMIIAFFEEPFMYNLIRERSYAT